VVCVQEQINVRKKVSVGDIYPSYNSLTRQSPTQSPAQSPAQSLTKIRDKIGDKTTTQLLYRETT
jgi:hypothetical protein